MTGSRALIAIAAICGFLSVAIGAFGAHGLPDHLTSKGVEPVDVLKKVANFETGARYMMFHALAILSIGVSSLWMSSKLPVFACYMFVIGMMLFSGGLFLTSVTDLKVHMIIPIGGVFFLIGWGLLFASVCCCRCCTPKVPVNVN